MNTLVTEAMVGVIILLKTLNMLMKDDGLTIRIMGNIRRENMHITGQQKAKVRVDQGVEVHVEDLLAVVEQYPVEKWSSLRDPNQGARMRGVENWSTGKRRSHIIIERKRLQA
jgi:hypothetical protein